MQCFALLNPMTLGTSGFTVPSVPCIEIPSGSLPSTMHDGLRYAHRARGEPSWGSGGYYSIDLPSVLSKEKSTWYGAFTCTQATPCNPSSWSQVLSSSKRAVFRTIPGTAPYNKGAKYQSGWNIRDGYLIVVNCYNFNWYSWRYQVRILKIPDKASITPGAKPRVDINFTGKFTATPNWRETNTSTQSEFFRILDDMDPSQIWYSSNMTASDRGSCALTGTTTWVALKYRSTSELSDAVWDHTVPSRYIKAVSTAYYDALAAIPSLSFNPLSALSDLKGLASLKLSVLSERLHKGVAADYLQYRYGIKPTLSDVSDISGTLSRVEHILSQDLVCNGYSTAADGTIVHVTLRYSSSTARDMLQYSALLKRIEQRSLVDSWDLVPFSFIVDWFIDVEKYLRDVSNLLVNLTWAPSEIWVSFQRSEPGVNIEYARIRGHDSLALTSIGLSDYVVQPDNRGIYYHLTDGLAIITQLFG